MKILVWVGSCKKELLALPEEVVQEFGFVLYLVQIGQNYKKVKELRGFGSGVYEIKIDFKTDTYRAVYVFVNQDYVYVLYCFKKKSKQGIGLSQQDINKIDIRLKAVRGIK